jgi:MscS family membrane protein
MELRTTISLRYETEPDQLRYVLATLRKMCLSHPRIDNETVRVRFIDYGASSLDIEIRIYALTKEWNDFYAIREDVLLRVNELVRESGASFAFPSQTVYLSRDGKADQARGDAAVQQVQDWRRSGQLPFPHMAHSDRISLAGTLEYPPKGSPDAEISRILDTEEAEPLFKEPESDEEPAEREKQ